MFMKQTYEAIENDARNSGKFHRLMSRQWIINLMKVKTWGAKTSLSQGLFRKQRL